jgi:predicted nuclease with TOPRIM domain
VTVDLEFLGKQTERILAELQGVREDMQNIKTRLTALESALDALLIKFASLNSRFNRMESR